MDTVREEVWPMAAPQQQQQQGSAPRGPHPQQQNGRVDLRDLKAQMEKRLGPDRSRRYFGYLSTYLSQKLSKPDFDRMCLLTLGRENLRLHNRLIRSVLYNAYQAQCPPPPPDAARSAKKVSQAAAGAFSSCNGDARLLQVQGSRPVGAAVQDHQLKDRFRNMGPNGRVEAAAAASHTQVVRGGSAAPENGALSSVELKRSVSFQQHEAKHLRVDQLLPENVLKKRRVVSDAAADRSAQTSRSPLRAPLGIPFCSASAGGARKLLPPPVNAGEDPFTSCYEHGQLLNTEVLRKRMEKTAESMGLVGVTMDCAELLNNGLDSYLKNLIRSSVDLKGADVRNDARRGASYKQQHGHGKQINGAWLPNEVQMQSSSGQSEASHDSRSRRLISADDFRVAMQLNPQQLGENWPVLLEKICIRPSEEND
ncbi:uncharacterized protein LOC124679192 [Lolium rigidum]|uniref:uncharacterized protein LOC124679192 n=1 Tax=Lolium rigidum TaxID=89674 RepID=UPI001F5D735C|nr:uncharacterized protein LOC124679192 [Lolium rigidum]